MEGRPKGFSCFMISSNMFYDKPVRQVVLNFSLKQAISKMFKKYYHHRHPQQQQHRRHPSSIIPKSPKWIVFEKEHWRHKKEKQVRALLFETAHMRGTSTTFEVIFGPLAPCFLQSFHGRRINTLFHRLSLEHYQPL